MPNKQPKVRKRHKQATAVMKARKEPCAAKTPHGMEDKACERRARYYAKHKDKLHEYNVRYYAENKDKYASFARAYRKTHPLILFSDHKSRRVTMEAAKELRRLPPELRHWPLKVG